MGNTDGEMTPMCPTQFSQYLLPPQFLHLPLQKRETLPQGGKVINAVRCPWSKYRNSLICLDGWIDIVTVHFV